MRRLVALLCTALVVVSGTGVGQSQQNSLPSGEIKGVLVEEPTIEVEGKFPPKATTGYGA